MSRTGAEIRASEATSKAIQDRITSVEKHLGQLCDTVSSYTRKTAHIRDKGDELAKNLTQFAEAEKINLTLKKGVTDFAEHLSAIQDYRQAEVQRLEAKVVSPLSNYGLLCKQTKNELKAAFASRDREQNQKKKLEKVRQKNPGDRRQISQAETELQKASVDATRSTKVLEQQMESFESKKVQDMKKIMTEFVNIEMMFHAKALEVYTKCFQSLAIIDSEADVEEFRKQIRPLDTSRMNIARRASESSINSNRTPSNDPTPTSQRKVPVASSPARSSQQPQQSTQKSQQNTTNARVEQDLEDDSDEYEDDDDDDDDYEDETTEAETARTNGSRKQ